MSAIDHITVLIIVFISAIILAVCYIVFQSFAASTMVSQTPANVMNNIRGTFFGLDYVLPFIFIGYYMVTMVLAVGLPRARPAIFVFAMLVMFIMVIFADIFKNVWLAFTMDDTQIAGEDFALINARFPLTFYLLNNLPMLSMAFFVLTMILTYGIPRVL